MQTGVYAINAVDIVPTRNSAFIRYEIIVTKPNDPAFGAVFHTLENWAATLCKQARDRKRLLKIGTVETKFGPKIISIEPL